MPPETRALTTSADTSEKRSKCLATPGNRELKTSIDAWSVLKKDRSTAIVAPVMQLCPDGWSENAGVESRARASLAAC